MSSRIYANLGFLLQISGLLRFCRSQWPILWRNSSGSWSLHSMRHVSWFWLSPERYVREKGLGFQVFKPPFVAAFIILPLIGAYHTFTPTRSAAQTPMERLSMEFRELSGFTTTVLASSANPDVLPKSILVYRSLTELMVALVLYFCLLPSSIEKNDPWKLM